jgi:hypothetical protein
MGINPGKSGEQWKIGSWRFGHGATAFVHRFPRRPTVSLVKLTSKPRPAPKSMMEENPGPRSPNG